LCQSGIKTVPQVRGDSFVVDDNRIVGERKSSSHANLRRDDQTYSFGHTTLKIIVKHSDNRGWPKHRTRKDGDALQITS